MARCRSVGRGGRGIPDASATWDASVLAGAQILRLPPGRLLAAVHAVVAGLSVMLWAFGTWLIPLLAAVGIWRHVLRRMPLAYEPGWWSISFPAGMYGVASHEIGKALKVPWLVTLDVTRPGRR